MADEEVVVRSAVDSTVGGLPNLSSAPNDALLVIEYLGNAFNVTLGQLKAALGAITSFAKTAGNGTPGSTDIYTVTFGNGTKLDMSIPIPKNGKDGEDGNDAVSPTAEVTETDTGWRVVITDKDGQHPFDLLHGKDGGDGVSPTVKTEQTDTGHRITITDKTGEHVLDLRHGIDGVSPAVSVHIIEGGYRVTFSDGVTSRTVDLYNGNSGDWSVNSPEVVGYIKGRTHWVESTWDELLTLTGATGGGITRLTEPIGLEIGKEYISFHNGIEVTCVATAYDDGSTTGIQLVGKDGASLNFTLVEFTGASTASGIYGTAILGLDGSATVNFVLVHTELVYHKLDNRFIDAVWMATTLETGTEIIPETTIEEPMSLSSIPRDVLVNGTEYIVTWNGVKYRLRCVGSGYGAALGNASLWSTKLENTGEPFLFWGIGTVKVFATEFPATFRVERIDNERLPYDYAPASYTISTEIGADEENNGRCTVSTSELMHVEYVLRCGGKVYGIVNNAEVEILSVYLDMDESNHGIIYRKHNGDVLYSRYSSNAYTKVDAMTPAVDRSDIILRSPSGKKFKFTVDDTGALTTTEVT